MENLYLITAISDQTRIDKLPAERITSLRNNKANEYLLEPLERKGFVSMAAGVFIVNMDHKDEGYNFQQLKNTVLSVKLQSFLD